MKITLTVKQEVDVKTLRVAAGVRYWNDATVNGVEGGDDDDFDPGIPLRDGDVWRIDIDVESGRILNWPDGTTASVHYKVCDQCGWDLLDSDGRVVAGEQDGYVPGTLCPGGEGYGDYIIMEIGPDGTIEDWRFDPREFEQDPE